METPSRRSLDETWRFLEEDGVEMPRDENGQPSVPAVMPSHDDVARLGFSYFRCGLFDADLSDVTLPRSFFGRSSFERVNFRNTDLSESRMCWNDFIQCDFSGANLAGCDMRASIFKDCKFGDARLSNADLRQSSFEGCDLTGAQMDGAKLTHAQWRVMIFSDVQEKAIDWHLRDGEIPPGG
jgi:uncharacterized protein YjbI with pentapeptide repeats